MADQEEFRVVVGIGARVLQQICVLVAALVLGVVLVQHGICDRVEHEDTAHGLVQHSRVQPDRQPLLQSGLVGGLQVLLRLPLQLCHAHVQCRQ